jgi:hypothetical protein
MPSYEMKIIALLGNDPFAGNLSDTLNDLGSQGYRIAGIEGRHVFLEREVVAEREERSERPQLRR